MIENRKAIYEEYVQKFGVPPNFVRRVMVEYDRYHEASLIVERLEKAGVDFKALTILDFGCGAGDYGMTFARKGSTVYFFDEDQKMLDLVSLRLTEKCHILPPETSMADFPVVDLAIFGEVLEHVKNAPEILNHFTHRDQSKYLFTSSYPYRPDDSRHEYWAKGGHLKEAREAQPQCRIILETHYEKNRMGGQLNLWIRK